MTTLKASQKTKQTPVGEIPVDWSSVSVGELCEKISVGIVIKPAQYYVEDGIRCFRSANVGEGRVKDSNWVFLSDEGNEKNKGSILYEGDVVIVRSGAPGTACVIPREYERSNCIDLVIARPKQDQVLSSFLAEFLNSSIGKRQILNSQGGLAQKHLNVGAVRLLKLPLPPLPEQKKIAEILGTWDRAIRTLEDLIAAKQERKRGLMQRLLFGKTRLPGFEGEWEEVRLGEIVRAIPRPRPKPETAFLSAGIRSHGKGVFLKEDFEPDDIALQELFELREGDLVASITFAWEGAIAIVPTVADKALVSHRFPTFECIDELICRDFLKHFIRTKRFVFECGLASPGGAGRNRVLNKRTFLKIPLFLPLPEEQKRIAEILDACDRELALLESQLAALRAQKRGLMQRLLTGQVRVKTKPEEALSS